MSIEYVYYDLHKGFIDNWLVAGPQLIPVKDAKQIPGHEDIRLQIARHFYEKGSGIHKQPVERGPLSEGVFKIGEYEGSWLYYPCREDHFVDSSVTSPAYVYLRSWAYVQIECERPQEASLILTSNGPADVWVNDAAVHRQEQFQNQPVRSAALPVSFKEGGNSILVRFEQVAIGNCPYLMALQVLTPDVSQPTGMRVRLPTLIQALERRNKLEHSFEAVYAEKDIFFAADKITVHWPESLPEPTATDVTFQTPTGRTYGQAEVDGIPGDSVFLSHSFNVDEGLYRAHLMPRAQEFYEQDLRITKDLYIWGMGTNQFSAGPYATYAQRREEALTVASQRENDVFGAIARMDLGRWDKLDSGVLIEAIESANQPLESSELNLLGMIGALARFGSKTEFPRSLKKVLKKFILNFSYWPVGLRSDGLRPAYASESQAILYHACEILAGQLYPDQIFTNSGKDGRWHRKRAERLALDWLKRVSSQGLSDWDSTGRLAATLVALSHLADLARTDQVYEMAAVLMDKLFFGMALNSFWGVPGSTHGHVDSAVSLKGGLLDPTAGITRLMWGMGVFNHFTAGPVSLACMKNYDLPPIISDIAASLMEEMWDRERSLVSSLQGAEKADDEINKVTFKTPDGMLSCAQDYHPGQKGSREHIWQASLGTSAVVFVTHPGNASEREALAPNFWVGNVVLPRAAQWKDVLVSFYNLPESDWMGFTHAYFPVVEFDEYTLRDGWAFARKGDGFLALTASQGFELIKEGRTAFRELRSYGAQNVWLVHMGRAALDGSFTEFQEKILALKVSFDGLSVDCQTLRGDNLAFDWEGPLLLNGQEQPLKGNKHFENPYCTADLPAAQMEIQFNQYVLKLDFSG
jgi:hypothetical protein